MNLILSDKIINIICILGLFWYNIKTKKIL